MQLKVLCNSIEAIIRVLRPISACYSYIYLVKYYTGRMATFVSSTSVLKSWLNMALSDRDTLLTACTTACLLHRLLHVIFLYCRVLSPLTLQLQSRQSPFTPCFSTYFYMSLAPVWSESCNLFTTLYGTNIMSMFLKFAVIVGTECFK